MHIGALYGECSHIRGKSEHYSSHILSMEEMALIIFHEILVFSCAGPEGGQGVWQPPRPPLGKNHKAIGSLSSTCPDPLENYKATIPAFNVEPLSPAIETFRWWADDGPL